MSTISVTDLAKRYADADVLSGISLEVDRGSVEVIIGPSGGGKSTFLRCLNGLESFHAGEIKVDDLVLTPRTDRSKDAALLERLRRKVGFVFQSFNLFPHLSVIDNLTIAPIDVLHEAKASAETRARALLDRIGLGEKARARPSTLSGGQQQRVAIVRALMMKPEVMLFDEPTSALDPVMACEVLDLMTELAKDGQTMVVVTHSMTFAQKVSTRVHLFSGGKNVESAPPDRFFGAPELDVTRTFLAKVAP